MDYEEMRVLFLYEFKLGHKGAEAARRINRAFGAGTIEQRSVRRWYSKFQKNDFSFENGSKKRKKRDGHNDENVMDANDKTQILNESLAMEIPFSQLKNVDKIFLFEYKLGHTPAFAAGQINEAFGSGTVSEETVKNEFQQIQVNVKPNKKKPASLRKTTSPAKKKPKAPRKTTSPAKKKPKASRKSISPSKKKLLAKVPSTKVKAVMKPQNKHKALKKFNLKLTFFGKTKKAKDQKHLLNS